MKDIKFIIDQPEGRRIEFKETLPKVSDLSKTIISFSNDAGGVLYLGIQDNPRKIIGLPENDLIKIEEKISNLIYDSCTPLISPNISIINIEDKYLIKVEVFKGNSVPYYLKSKGKESGTYIRVGSSNRQATSDIISELERRNRNISFDSELVYEKDFDEINIDKFKEFYKEKTSETLDNNILIKLQLLSDERENKFTNALLLFSDDKLRRRIFPYAKIECARFKGVQTEEFIDQKTIDSNILLQAEETYDFILRHINKGATVKGVYTESKWEYPVKAIREVIRNAIVHRDYSLTGKDIKIAIYDDMIEITSPGKLLPSIDFEELEARQSDIRNKIIAPVFKHLGLIDQWGNGLKLISEELKVYPEIEFKWFEKGLQFQVQFIKKNISTTKLRLSHDQVTTKLRLSYDQVTTMLETCLTSNSRKAVLDSVGYADHTDSKKKLILPLIKEGLLAYTIPDIIKSPNQKYITTEYGKEFLNSK